MGLSEAALPKVFEDNLELKEDQFEASYQYSIHDF